MSSIFCYPILNLADTLPVRLLVEHKKTTINYWLRNFGNRRPDWSERNSRRPIMIGTVSPIAIHNSFKKSVYIIWFSARPNGARIPISHENWSFDNVHRLSNHDFVYHRSYPDHTFLHSMSLLHHKSRPSYPQLYYLHDKRA